MRMRRILLCFMLFFIVASVQAEEVPAYYNADVTTSSISIAQRNVAELPTIISRYQNAALLSWQPILLDSQLKLHAKNASVVLLREKLVALGDMSATDTSDIFNEAVFEGVKHFQMRHGLVADGIIGKKTRAALNVTPQARLQQLQLNIQRWSALSTRMGARYVMVNVPAYELYLVEDNKTILTMKVIIGKPTRQTPEIYSKINRLVFKPYWHVPERIARKDIMKKAIHNPNYLDENNIRVYDDENHSFEINNDTIDWQTAEENGSSFHFRQDPGEKNSLGLVKFEFPNAFDIYLHDTPAKELFAQDARDLSSGCVRLERPFDLVEYLMKDDPAWDYEREEQLLMREKPTYVSVKKPIPVILTYLTAWIDDAGNINFREDIYDRDQLTVNTKVGLSEEAI